MPARDRWRGTALAGAADSRRRESFVADRPPTQGREWLLRSRSAVLPLAGNALARVRVALRWPLHYTAQANNGRHCPPSRSLDGIFPETVQRWNKHVATK